MTPEKLLEAMIDLEDNTIMDARKTTPHRGGTRKFVVLIAAVVAMMAIGLTAFAAEEISGWFARYFANNAEMPLSTEQLDFIEENEQNLSQSQSYNGFTVELKSAISDGKIAYITLGLTAPEDVYLNKTVIEGYSEDKPVIRFRNYDGEDKGEFLYPASGQLVWGSRGSYTVEDNDGLDNTQDLLITLEPSYNEEDGNPLAPGTVWNIHIDEIVAGYVNEAYRKVLDEKYAGTNTLIPGEEAAKLYPEVVLAEGDWNFEITFADSKLDCIELVSEPVTTLACVGMKADGTNVYEDVQITSCKLRSLSVSLNYDRDYGVEFTNNWDRLVYVVMKDGSRIRLNESGYFGDGLSLIAETPIILDEVSHILLADGTEIPMITEQVAEVELIDTPITLSICVGMRPEDGRDVYMDMKITSFVLRSLSASIYCEDTSFAPEIGNNFDRPIYVVMEDGQRIRLKADTGLPGEQKLVAEAPILLESVDYVLLPGGTKLPMP